MGTPNGTVPGQGRNHDTESWVRAKGAMWMPNHLSSCFAALRPERLRRQLGRLRQLVAGGIHEIEGKQRRGCV